MKLIFTLYAKNSFALSAAALLMTTITYSQVTTVCTNPTNTAYGLTSKGEIYEINSLTGATIRVIKNNTYAGNSPSSANGLGYNSFNGKFYYFKRNVTSSPQEFVSFNPALNVVAPLAASTCTNDIHTGCVSFNGAGYYTTDIQGTLHYYNIATNTWTFVTSKVVDQFGNDITALMKTQNAGDMAIDGLGNMWLLTSSNSNYGLYKFPANLPTTAVAQVNVVQWIAPTAVTPTGVSIRGIAFKPNGQVLLATGDDKLYVLQTTNTLTFVGNLTTSDVGNDLTSCSFPAGILPVTWKSFDATVQNNNSVTLNWEVMEYQNKGFYIQHSTNGADWDNIAFVASRGDKESFNTYSYKHTNNQNGLQYYRIKQVDIDEKISYSAVATVMLKNDEQNISIWPNPATSQIRIASNNSDKKSPYTKAQIFDLSGRKLTETLLQANTGTIDVSRLSAGTYLIKIESKDGTNCSQKIVKQ